MENKKVVVADDEIHIVQVVAMKLRNNGFDVVTAQNGAEAYDLCLNEKPDLLITDYQMPLMTGIDLIKKLRTVQEFSCLPVIVLTARGFAIEEDVQKNLNITKFLSKPFSPKELLAHVENSIGQTVSE